MCDEKVDVFLALMCASESFNGSTERGKSEEGNKKRGEGKCR